MFKTFDPQRDIKTQISSINEVMIFDRGIFTGTTNDGSIRKYNHWVSGSKSGSLYQSLYDNSSQTIELLNITYGQHISSTYYSNALATNKIEKNKMYRLHAKMLLGNENERFVMSGTAVNDLIFLHIKRSIMKDEIKKGTLSISSIFSGSNDATFSSATITDAGSESRYSSTDRADVGNLMNSSGKIAGQIYYNAGVLALIPEVFSCTSSVISNPGNFWSGSQDYFSLAISGGTGGTYENLLNGIRYRVRNTTIINQTNLQSTYYFCRALNDEFNYSSNPTFLDSSQRIIPTSGSNSLQTRTYITKVGLLGENQELLAIASLGQPLKKSPETELTIKIRLDN